VYTPSHACRIVACARSRVTGKARRRTQYKQSSRDRRNERERDMTTTVHAFFAECAKYEPLPERRQQLRLLAIGVGGLILKKATHYALIFDDGEYRVPDTYTDSARDALAARLWPDDGEYARLRAAIGNTKLSWTTLRKNEKLTLIDQYVVAALPPASRALTRSALILAALFKLVSAADVVYNKYEIVSASTDAFSATYRGINCPAATANASTARPVRGKARHCRAVDAFGRQSGPQGPSRSIGVVRPEGSRVRPEGSRVRVSVRPQRAIARAIGRQASAAKPIDVVAGVRSAVRPQRRCRSTLSLGAGSAEDEDDTTTEDHFDQNDADAEEDDEGEEEEENVIEGEDGEEKDDDTEEDEYEENEMTDMTGSEAAMMMLSIDRSRPAPASPLIPYADDEQDDGSETDDDCCSMMTIGEEEEDDEE
jgi:hypothetical protein